MVAAVKPVEVVAFPKPITFAPGDVVKHRDYPEVPMTIEYLRPSGEVDCVWFDDMHLVQRKRFHASELNLAVW